MKITLLIILGFLFFAGGGFFFLMKEIYDEVDHNYSQAAEEPLVDFAHLFASLLEQDIKDGEISIDQFRSGFKNAYQREFEATIHRLQKTEIQTHVYVTNAAGMVIFDSNKGETEGQDYSEKNDVFLVNQGKYGARSSRIDIEDSRTSVFFIAAPIYHDDRIIGTLTVSRPETAMAPFADQARRNVLKWSIIAGFVVVALGAIWTYWLLSPIGGLTSHAHRISAGERTDVPTTGHAELKTLSVAIENMRRELEGKHYVENYVQALTHELKSTIAAIRGAAELIDENMPPEKQARFLENILAETSRSEDIVRRLVQLAALESQTTLSQRCPIDLRQIVTEEVEQSAAMAEPKGIALKVAGPEEHQKIEGDPLMIQIAVRNLLSNAIDFSPENGTVKIGIQEADRTVDLSVSDEGPGIPDYAETRIFDRFYSLKHNVTGRKGSGLGLCFVREAMELHGGSASLSNRSPKGSLALLKFPVS